MPKQSFIGFVGIVDESGSNTESYYQLKDDQFELVARTSLPPPKDGLIGDGPAWRNTYSSNPAYCHPQSETPRNYH